MSHLFNIPDIVLVGYGSTQTYQIKCLKCGRTFFEDSNAQNTLHTRELFCDECSTKNNLGKYLHGDNISDHPCLGNVVGWEVRLSTQGMKRNRYNYNKVYKRDSYTCQYCGYSPMKHEEFRPLHIDHLVPWCVSGSNSLDNLVVSCEDCNKIASSKWFDSFFNKRGYILSKMKERNKKIYTEI